jgi:membrane glycosyltransferase
MNKTTEYIDAMPLSDIEKAALPKTDIRAVHQALDAEHHVLARR